VDLDHAAWRQGHDLQLEKAVELVMEQLRQHPTARPMRPPYPDYQHRAAGAAKGQ